MSDRAAYVLAAAIVLAGVLVAMCVGGNGRYASYNALILDTRTGEVWAYDDTWVRWRPPVPSKPKKE